MQGLKIGRLNAVFSNVELDFGLTIESFEITGANAAADLDPFKLNLDQPGTLRAVVSQDAVAKFLETKSPDNISGFNIQITGGQIFVSATAQVVLNIPVKAIATLEIVEKKKLNVKLVSVDVLGGKAKSLVESQIAKTNPIIDLTDLPFPVELTEVEMDNGQVVLHGIVSSTS